MSTQLWKGYYSKTGLAVGQCSIKLMDILKDHTTIFPLHLPMSVSQIKELVTNNAYFISALTNDSLYSKRCSKILNSKIKHPFYK